MVTFGKDYGISDINKSSFKMKIIDSGIQKGFISTTSKITGTYKTENILITTASPHYSRNTERGFNANPASRNALTICFKTEPYNGEFIIPDYSHACEIITNFLSVIYGKRLDFHGLFESSGFFSLPDFNQYNTLCNPNLSFNSYEERKDIIVKLDLNAIKNIDDFIYKNAFDERFNSIVVAVCKFYAESLRIAEKQPDLAYLQLITALEILSSYYEYETEDLLEDKELETLKLIEEKLNGGKVRAKRIKKLIYGVKKKFTKTILRLIDDSFFIQGDNYYIPLKKEEFETSVKSAYDLRSEFVHTGKEFGNWVKPYASGNESQMGTPRLEDKNFAKTIAKAPTFSGLERIVRFCIIKFIQENGLDLIENQCT